MQNNSRKVFDLQSIEENKSHSNIFLKRLNEYTDFLQILNEKTYFKILLSILQKSYKSKFELEILKYILSKIPNLVNLSISPEDSEILLKDIFLNISLHLKYSDLMCDEMLYRYGEKNEYCYIILDGCITLINPKECIINMNEEEYLIHLTNLKINHEFELLSKIIGLNNSLFKLDKDFENWLLDPHHVELKRSFKVKSFLELSKLLDKIIESMINEKPGEGEIKKGQIINENDYLNKINLITSLKKMEEKKLVKTFQYKVSSQISKGELLGDFNLNDLKKKQSTAITNSQTLVCFIEKKVYEDILKESLDKHKRKNIEYLLTFSLFLGTDTLGFFTHYLKGFVSKKIDKEKSLLKENRESKYIYLIKSGRFEISKSMSILELNDLIKYYQDRFHINALQSENEELRFKSDKYLHSINVKKKLLFAIYGETDVIGLDDMIRENINLYSVKCISNDGEILKIKLNDYKNIVSNFKIVENNTNNFIQRKKDFFFKKILEIKQTQLKMIDDLQVDTVIVDQSKNEFEKKFITKKQYLKKASSLTKKEDFIKEVSNNQEKKIIKNSISLPQISPIKVERNSNRRNQNTKSSDNILKAIIKHLDNSDSVSKEKGLMVMSQEQIFISSQVKNRNKSDILPMIKSQSLSLVSERSSKKNIQIKRGELKFNKLFQKPTSNNNVIYSFINEKGKHIEIKSSMEYDYEKGVFLPNYVKVEKN